MEIKTLTSAEICKKEKIKAEYAQIVSRRINVAPYSGNPYFEIVYYSLNDNKWHIGFGSFELRYVEKWLNEEFEAGYKSVETAIIDLMNRAEASEAALKGEQA